MRNARCSASVKGESQEELDEASPDLAHRAMHFALMALFMVATVIGATLRKGVWRDRNWVGVAAALLAGLYAYRLWTQSREHDG